jgi:acetyl-CoA C-acetyltransferase
MRRDSNTPVLVGVGFADQRCDDPADAVESCQLMANAVEAAAADAGSRRILEQVDAIHVPQGMWEYSDPGRLVAERVGAGKARTVLAGIGILQQRLFCNACRAIASGESKVVVVTGGEARYRALRAGLTGKPAPETVQKDVMPDEQLSSSDPLWAQLEADRGLMMPVAFYAIMENALRYSRGRGMEETRDELAQLYAGFSRIAAENPHAWKRNPVSPQEIRDPIGKNKMLAYPYTKLHNSQWNVDQASALLFCAAGLAEELGIKQERWVFPLASTESNYAVPLSQRPALHRSLGAELAGSKAMALAGVDPEQIAHLDLYTCFPSAVQIFAAALGFDLDRPLTVTGGMPFAGGPLNNYVIQATARMAEVLREDPGSVGLVSCVSGILGKQGFGVWSAQPNPDGFQFADLTDETARRSEVLELTDGYQGPATVAGYTVVYTKDDPSKGVVICDLPDGRRTVANSVDGELLDAMVREEFCGREVRILERGRFALP